MKYIVEVEKSFRATQGLASPIRNSQGLRGLQPSAGYEVTLKVGVMFDEAQLTDRGWFVDTDAIDELLSSVVSRLQNKKWTTQFEFRPTFELVSKWAYAQLEPDVKQLHYVVLVNQTLGITVRYTK